MNDLSQSTKNTMGSKQKTSKGWSHLPAELICRIAKDLFDWELERIHFPSAVMYYDQESIMRAKVLAAMTRAFDMPSQVCHRWREAIAKAAFWKEITSWLYKRDKRMWTMLLNHWFDSTTGVEHLITRRHYYAAREQICGVCTVYGSKITVALSGAVSPAYAVGMISLCKYHEQNGFCGMCLKDDNALKLEPPDYTASLSPVDDFDTWFGNIQYTCEHCRTLAIKTALRQHRISDRILPNVDMEEAFQNYQAFSEGALQTLCFQVLERVWLLSNTKIKDFSLQAVAGDRLLRGMPMAEAMNSDPEDSYILYNEPSIRELAMRDFMRHKIMEGNWFTPYDIVELQYAQPSPAPYFQNGHVCHLPVIHPTRQERTHIEWGYIIPTIEFKDGLQTLWHQNMVDILESAFKNIIAEVLDGCLVDAKVWEYENTGIAPGNISDPGQTLQSWSLTEVWERLLKSEYWVTGYNWRSRKLAEHRDRRASDASSRSKSSPASSDSSRPSESPTGTVSTYQTTPSPPPASIGKPATISDTASTTTDSEMSKSPTSPVASQPGLPDIELTGAEERMVQSVPFVPASWEVLPPHTLRWIKGLWTKSIHPFVACQCGICKRACRLQEEERLRGATRKAPTGGIVINEPKKGKAEDDDDEDDDEDDILDGLDDTEDDYGMLNAMEVSPEIELELALSQEDLRNENTPVQLVQQPATPPALGDSELPMTPRTPPKTVRTQPSLLSRISQKSATPIGSLSPPSWRKRLSQELESLPSSPSSAKRRRLDSGDSKIDTPSPSPLSPSGQEHLSRSSSDAEFPPTSQSQFMDVTGLKEAVRENLLDVTLDEDVVNENTYLERNDTLTQTQMRNEAMQVE